MVIYKKRPVVKTGQQYLVQTSKEFLAEPPQSINNIFILKVVIMGCNLDLQDTSLEEPLVSNYEHGPVGLCFNQYSHGFPGPIFVEKISVFYRRIAHLDASWTVDPRTIEKRIGKTFVFQVPVCHKIFQCLIHVFTPSLKSAN